MGASYRYIQTDFSAGQLDPMIEANLNFAYKQVGLKQSLNTVHNVNHTASKRPGTTIIASGAGLVGPDDGKATIQLPARGYADAGSGGEYVNIYFGDCGQTRNFFLLYNDAKIDLASLVGAAGPFQTAVYQNFLFVVGKNIKLCKIIKFTGTYSAAGVLTAVTAQLLFGNADPSVDTIQAADWVLPGGLDANSSFSSICFAEGHLLVSAGNALFISRSRVAGTLEEDATTGFPKWTINFTLFDTVNGEPVIYATHGIEIRENDMYGSRIMWIAYIGRVIVATESAIFMSTEQAISPLTFDLVLTSYHGSSPTQPEIVANMIVYSSTDRKKLYSGVFDYDSQGLIITDMTSTVRNAFNKRIQGFWSFDYPEISIYAATEDGKIYFCQPTSSSSSGYIYSWSEWQMPSLGSAYKRKAQCFFLNRSLDGTSKVYMLMGSPTYGHIVLKIDWADVYDVNTGSGILDFAKEFTGSSPEVAIGNELMTITPALPVIGATGDTKATAFVTYDSETRVYQGLQLSSNGTYEVPVPPDYISGDDITIRIGFGFTARFLLFRQLLPNNSGTALSSKYSIKEISVKLFHSFAGYLEIGGVKTADFPMLYYGEDQYSDSIIDPTTLEPYCRTGTLIIKNPCYAVSERDAVDNSSSVVVESDIAIVADSPYPFNLMAVGIYYNITEVN
ncbi:MAG: hypothetical protein WCR70_07375 [Sphaerochaetaceae bacterium]